MGVLVGNAVSIGTRVSVGTVVFEDARVAVGSEMGVLESIGVGVSDTSTMDVLVGIAGDAFMARVGASVIAVGSSLGAAQNVIGNDLWIANLNECSCVVGLVAHDLSDDRQLDRVHEGVFPGSIISNEE